MKTPLYVGVFSFLIFLSIWRVQNFELGTYTRIPDM